MPRDKSLVSVSGGHSLVSQASVLSMMSSVLEDCKHWGRIQFVWEAGREYLRGLGLEFKIGSIKVSKSYQYSKQETWSP